MKHLLFILLTMTSIVALAGTCDDTQLKIENISPDEKVGTLMQYMAVHKQCLTENHIIDPSQSEKNNATLGCPWAWCIKIDNVCVC